MADDFLTIAQVVLAAALVAATVFLAWYTKGMARAMWNQLDWAIRPIVAPTLEFIGPVYVTFRFQNVGNGVANDVRVRATSDPQLVQFDWAYPSLLPGQSAAILQPKELQTSDSLAKLQRVVFDVACLDVWGSSRAQRHVLELGPFHAQLEKATTMWERTEKELLETQVEKLDRIASEIGRLAEAMRKR